MSLTASLVLYCNPNEMFEMAIKSFLAYPESEKLIIIDNSPYKLFSTHFNDSKIQYFWTGVNIGFGGGHNLAISLLNKIDGIHIIMNPDVDFKTDVPIKIEYTFEKYTDVVILSPQIRFPDENIQEGFRLLPTPWTLFSRRFLSKLTCNRLLTKINVDINAYEIIDVPLISGCFLALRLNIFSNIGGFDERFFMFMEDVDLVRRMGKHGRIAFMRDAFIYHRRGAGSYKSVKLLIFHIISVFKYFTKWGWFFDFERLMINQKFVKKFKYNVLSDVP